MPTRGDIVYQVNIASGKIVEFIFDSERAHMDFEGLVTTWRVQEPGTLGFYLRPATEFGETQKEAGLIAAAAVRKKIDKVDADRVRLATKRKTLTSRLAQIQRDFILSSSEVARVSD